MKGLLSRLMAGRGAVAQVELGGVPLGLRLLNEQDYQDAGFAVEAEMRASGVALDMASAELFEREKSGQLLARALVDPSSGDPIAASAKELRQALGREDAEFLIERYLDHEKRHSPKDMSESEFSELLEDVKKNAATTRLDGSSFATLKRIITCLASPPAN